MNEPKLIAPNWFLWLARIEGISCIALFLFAMPMKYLASRPEFMRTIGSLHGGLFVAFVLAVLIVRQKQKWPLAESVFALVASVPPFGTFVFEALYLKEKKAA